MYKWFERYFAFSRRELNGICVLGVLIFILWLAAHVMTWETSVEPGDMARRIEEIERFLATQDMRDSSDRAQRGRETVPSARPSVPLPQTSMYFPFDPNGLPDTAWKKLGLSDRQIAVIKNYEAKGGRFRKKEDVRKIYSISDADYERLEPYIRISADDSVKRTHSGAVRPVPLSPINPIELNSADSLVLQRLPGIGSVFASRIIRFRDRLGGFCHVDQLLDVYGMDSTRYRGFCAYVYVDSNRVRKIDINAAGYEHLRNHPFISPKLANAMVQYRKQHGPYRSLPDLRKIAIMDDAIFRKIVPYLTISHD